MTRLLFVGDGPTDRACVPPLVESILHADISADCRQFLAWRDVPLHRGGIGDALSRKLKTAITFAFTSQHAAIVATIDTDREKRGRKSRELDAVRTVDKRVPVALGEATPHLEAWLIDDQKAVRTALGLPAGAEVPAATKCEPKPSLNGLCEQSPLREARQPVIQLLERIAREVDVSRCTHKTETGFADFAADVQRVLLPLIPPNS